MKFSLLTVWLGLVASWLHGASACSFSTEDALNQCLLQTMSADEIDACDDCVIARVVNADTCNEVAGVFNSCPCGSCRDEFMDYANCIFAVYNGFECVPIGSSSSSSSFSTSMMMMFGISTAIGSSLLAATLG